MTCILTMDDALAEIGEHLAGLVNNVSEEDQKALNKIDSTFSKAVHEINNGGLHQETCQKMSALMIGAEGRSKVRVLSTDGNSEDLNMYEGLKRIHDEMQLVANVFEEANEGGGKDCSPWC